MHSREANFCSVHRQSMESEDCLPCLPEPATSAYSEPAESSTLPPVDEVSPF
jgi:hypothetical protein